MREGIHLGKPKSRLGRPVVFLLVAAGAGALALGVLQQRARTEIEALRSDVESLEKSLVGTEPRAPSDGDRAVAARLHLALAAGAPDAVPPTALLGLVESALPDEVVLESLSFGASPRPSLQLEASALDGARVTELQRRLQNAPLVSTTSLLEERRLGGGRLAVRIQVDLEKP